MRCEPRPGSYAPRSPLAAELILKGFFFSLFANVRGRFTPNVGKRWRFSSSGTRRGRRQDALDDDDHRRAQASARSSQIPGRGPHIDTRLHEPRRCRVSKRVRRHDAFESSVLHHRLEHAVDPPDRLAFPFHNVTRFHTFPAPQMRQKLRRQWRRRSALVHFLLTFRPAIKDTAFKIDVASARFALKRRLSYRLRAAPSVERDQDKARNVTTRMLQ